MNKKLRNTLLLTSLRLFFCLFVLGQGTSAQAASFATPEQAFDAVQESIKEADYNLFLQAVDVDTLVQKGVKESLDTLVGDKSVQKLAQENMLLQLLIAAKEQSSTPQIDFVSQFITSEIKTFVSSGITGGYFNGAPNGKTTMKKSSLLANVSTAAKSFTPAQLLSNDSSKAVVATTFSDVEAGAFPLELDMRKGEAGWRVVGIRNIADLVQKALQ